jgi:fimbrial chaperone protein
MIVGNARAATWRGRLVRLIVVLGVVATRSEAAASSFTVNPTQIYLSGRTVTALVTLRNESTEPLRFQVSAFSWDQEPSGEMQLHPTEDVVVFPALLMLEPGEERRIRVGSVTAFAATERTYRIFVEELPSADPLSTPGPGVKVLTRMGIPIFLRPPRMVAEARLQDLRVSHGRFAFALRNSGTVHFVPEVVRVRALGPSKTVLIDRQLDGWYILAGGTRVYDLPVAADDCERATSFVVDVKIGASLLTDRLDVSPADCTP